MSKESLRGISSQRIARFTDFIMKKPSNLWEEENSIELANGYAEYLKDRFIDQIPITKTLEKAILGNIKNVNIKHLKSSLKSNSPKIIKKLCEILHLDSINDITSKNTISKIYYENLFRDSKDYENTHSNDEKAIIIRNSYVTFDNIQILFLNSSISAKKHLTTIDFTGNKLGDKGIKNLINALKQCMFLSHLILSDNNISESKITKITSFLQVHSLKTLDLSCNNLGTGGAHVLLSFLLLSDKKNTLAKLNISFNNIEDDSSKNSIMYYVVNLLNKTNIEALNISNNKIGCKPSNLLEFQQEIIKNTSLRELDVSNNRMNVDSTKSLIYFLSKTVNLIYLNMAGNDFSIHSSDLLRLLPKVNKFLLKINLDSNDLNSIFYKNGEIIISEIQDTTKSNLEIRLESTRNCISELIKEVKKGPLSSFDKDNIKIRLLDYKITMVLFEEVLSQVEDPHKDDLVNLLENIDYKDFLYQFLDPTLTLGDIQTDPNPL